MTHGMALKLTLNVNPLAGLLQLLEGGQLVLHNLGKAGKPALHNMPMQNNDSQVRGRLLHRFLIIIMQQLHSCPLQSAGPS